MLSTISSKEWPEFYLILFLVFSWNLKKPLKVRYRKVDRVWNEQHRMNPITKKEFQRAYFFIKSRSISWFNPKGDLPGNVNFWRNHLFFYEIRKINLDKSVHFCMTLNFQMDTFRQLNGSAYFLTFFWIFDLQSLRISLARTALINFIIIKKIAPHSF